MFGAVYRDVDVFRGAESGLEWFKWGLEGVWMGLKLFGGFWIGLVGLREFRGFRVVFRCLQLFRGV